jgi:multidrug transporter EmrE-like cation transporter
MGDISPGAGVAVGIVVGLLSTCVQSVGLTLQRKSHMLEDSKEDHETRRAPYRRRRWQIGMSLFLLANIIGSTIQITTLPLPLLSTLQASGLVFNSIMASLILKEAWTYRTLVGTALVAGGAVLISLFSALPEPSHNLEQLLRLLRYPNFLVWFILSLVFAVGILVMDFALRHVIAVHKRESPKILLIRGMAYGLLSGILSAHALLLAKSAVELIVRSLTDHVNEFRSYQSWLLVLAFLVLALTQLYYLHLGLKLVSTSVLYPFVFCIYNIVAILDGLIYFRQTDRLPPLHAGLIGLGTFILLAGVLALSWRLQDDEDGDEQDRRHQMAQAEIPQTVLAPGMGFVGEPDTDTASSSAATDEEAGSEEDLRRSAHSEGSPLISKVRSGRGSNSAHSPATTRRRKRASTLKEIYNIWEMLDEGAAEEEEAGRYGTFNGRRRSSANARPTSASAVRPRPHSSSHLDVPVIDGNIEDEATAAEADTEDQRAGLLRSNSLPLGRRSRSARKRRHSRSGQGALFSDMLRVEWWRSRRRKQGVAEGLEEEDDEAPRQNGSRDGQV